MAAAARSLPTSGSTSTRTAAPAGLDIDSASAALELDLLEAKGFPRVSIATPERMPERRE